MHNKQPDNNVLRSVNDRIRCENIAIREVLKKMICPSCGSPSVAEGERMQSLQKLRQENLELRQELYFLSELFSTFSCWLHRALQHQGRKFERVSTVLANYMGRQGPAFDKPNASGAGQGSGNAASGVDSVIDDIHTDEFCLPYPMEANPDATRIAKNAKRELIKLLRMDEPLWIKSPVDDHLVLDHDSYNKIIPQSAGSRFLRSRRESSKDTGVVNMDARLLVDLYLDRDEWLHHFPTAVSKVKIIDVLAAGYSGTRSGLLQLVHEQMHILSPLIQPQEFCILRYCRQIETGVWVIADVSCDLRHNCGVSRTSCWKHPSGCMIKCMSNGRSKVTCVEHVEIDDVFLVHPAHEDLVKSAFRLGAKRWLMTLQKTCERYFYMSEHGRPGRELGGGRSRLIRLASRMVRSYCSVFSFLSTRDLHQQPQLSGTGVQIALRKSTCPGQPIGIVILAASSFWIPASPLRISEYLSDRKRRSQWDVLYYGNHVCEIMRIPTGRHSVNHISVLQALDPIDNVIFQETMMEPSGALIVYAPIHASIVSQVAMGMDSTTIPILASGFAVNGRGGAVATTTGIASSSGSFLTVGFQFLACTSLSTQDVDVNAITTVHSFVNRTIRLIKAAFDC